MPILRLAVVVAILLTPAYAVASPLFITVLDAGPSFGTDPLDETGTWQVEDGNGSLFDLRIQLLSGPLLDLDVDEENGFTTYTYGPGTVELTASQFTSQGVLVTGHFVAPTRAFSFTVCEGCDTLFDASNADDFTIGFGPGRFDKALARMLKVQQDSVGGGIDYALEDITGGPDDRFRISGDRRGFAPLSINVADAVPEPGLLMLGLVGGAGWVARMRRARR